VGRPAPAGPSSLPARRPDLVPDRVLRNLAGYGPLEGYLRERPATSGPLIRRAYRRALEGLAGDKISGLVSNWMSEAGIKRYCRDGVSAHALRHTSATDMLRAGAHLWNLLQALGHAHLATTETDLPLVVHDLREATGGRQYRHPLA
jgi:integrase